MPVSRFPSHPLLYFLTTNSLLFQPTLFPSIHSNTYLSINRLQGTGIGATTFVNQFRNLFGFKEENVWPGTTLDLRDLSIVEISGHHIYLSEILFTSQFPSPSISGYIKGARALIYMYSLSDPDGEDKVIARIESDLRSDFNTLGVTSFNPQIDDSNRRPSMMVATHLDQEHVSRTVSEDAGRALATKYGMPFFEVSCTEGTNFNLVRQALCDLLKIPSSSSNEAYDQALEQHLDADTENKASEHNTCTVM